MNSSVCKVQTWVNFGPEENPVLLLQREVSLSLVAYLRWLICKDINRKNFSCNLNR